MKRSFKFKMVRSVCRYFFLSLCILHFSYILKAQNLVYAKGIINSLYFFGTANSNSIKTDNPGNIYVTGNFTGTADFDPGPGISNLTATGNSDIYFAKYNASGNYVYAKAFGGPGVEDSRQITVDVVGNVYITGYFTGTADFDPGVGTANLTSAGVEDIFIAKYDTAGNYIYAKRLGGTGKEIANGISVDLSGKVYITGYFNGTADFDPGTGVANVVSKGLADIFIAKYDTNGNYVFARGIGGAFGDSGNGISTDASGNLYITGSFANTVDFNPGSTPAVLTTNSNISNAFLARYDASGNYVYAKVFPGPGSDAGTNIVTDASGNSYITGVYASTADFDPGIDSAILKSVGSNDIFFAAYDPLGNYVYAKSIGGINADYVTGIAIDNAGNAYLTGYFTGTIDFDPGVGVMNISSDMYLTDVFIARYNSSGNYVYAKTLDGTTGTENISGITVDSSGSVYFTGSFNGAVDFDPGPGIANLNIDATGNNAYITRLDNTGNYVDALQLGNYSMTISHEQGKSIAVDSVGSIYITGYFSSTVDFDPGPGTALRTSSGQEDIFIAKYDASGNLVFVKVIGGTGSDIGNGIVLDASGNIIITGYLSRTVDFDPGSGVASLTSVAGSPDIFFAKYDPAGNYLFAKGIGGTYNDFGNALAVDNAGNIFITGFFSTSADFDPDGGVATLTNNSGSQDIFFARYNSSGGYVYAKAIGGPGNDNSTAIAINSVGNVFITGDFRGTVDFDPGTGSALLTVSAGPDDIFVARYDANGNYVYAKSTGGGGAGSNDYDITYGIAIDSADNVYVTGVERFTFSTLPPDQNIIIARYDAAGNNIFKKVIFGDGNEHVPYSFFRSANGDLYLAGVARGKFDFDPGPGSTITPGSEFGSFFLARYDASGNFLKVTVTSGGFAGAHGMTSDKIGNIFITGTVSGSVDFSTSGSNSNAVINAAAESIFFTKYSTANSLPINLKNFTARLTPDEKDVDISWLTSSQINNAYFEVERSADGIRFESIGRIAGCLSCKDDQFYKLKDSHPYTGVSYYRLKQVDVDGQFSYSIIATVNIIGNSTSYIYPTVTKGDFYLIVNNDQQRKQVSVEIVSAGGNLIRRLSATLNEGVNNIKFNLANQSKGTYYIRISADKSNRSQTFKVIKN